MTDLTPELLAAIASVNSRGEKSTHLGEVETWFRSYLATLAPGDTLGSRQLIERLEIDDEDQLTKKRLMQSLFWLRKLGKIEDCYSHSQTRRWFTNPLIVYRNPIQEGIF